VHILDAIVVCTAVVLVVCFAGVLARQRYMLRSTGALPMAMHGAGNRWMYGIGRYEDGELRFYRALGWGTRPSRVFRRGHVEVLGRRRPTGPETASLPPTSVVVDCRVDGETIAFAIGDSAFTGFVSWLESSAPR
jgi:hypothetical protein